VEWISANSCPQIEFAPKILENSLYFLLYREFGFAGNRGAAILAQVFRRRSNWRRSNWPALMRRRQGLLRPSIQGEALAGLEVKQISARVTRIPLELSPVESGNVVVR